jgi:hypothetical protein
MEEEEESSVSELTEAETVESPGEVADDAGLLKVGYGKSVLVYVRERFFIQRDRLSPCTLLISARISNTVKIYRT